jgi:DNA-binding MarR family transcriptional regulator
LGAETLVTSGTMTNRIDRLESRGLVRREPDPSDRRGVRVLLTDPGRRAVDDAMSDLLAREHELLAALTAEQRTELSALLRILVQQFGD